MSGTLKKIGKLCRHPIAYYKRFLVRKLDKKSEQYSDEEYIRKHYKIMLNKKLDLDNPVTFNEKLQWLKLNYRFPLLNTMVDKYLVKDYVEKIIGSDYIAKLYGVWDSFDDIDFESLPNTFVLKETHLSGLVWVCRDKLKEDPKSYKKKFDNGLKNNYYLHCREWPYKDIKPRIIAEELIVDESYKNLPVYKFFCFNGEPYLVQTIQNDKQKNETIDYFDIEWNPLKLKQNFPNSKVKLPKPSKLDEMLGICKRLTKGFPFLRCDLYLANDKVYFSEFTFFSDAGFQPFHPKKWDRILGDKIILPEPRNETKI